MRTRRYVALAIRHNQGLTAHGTFASHADARLATDWLATSDDRVIATRPVLLHPPDPGRPSVTSTLDKVIELPAPITRLLRTDGQSSTMDSDGPIVVLAVLTTPRDHALLVGPFATANAAQRWHQHTGDPIAPRVGECHLLPLRAVGFGTKAPGSSEPVAVILLDVDDTSVVYGPFTTSMDAALFWHDFTTAITLTNVHRVHICELTPPTTGSNTTTIRGSSEPDTADGRIQGWVIRLASTGHADPLVIGPFPDQHTARTWRDTTPTTAPGTILPIYTTRTRRTGS